MIFVLQMVSALLEPVGVVGYALSGLLLPRLYLSLPAALGWAALMQAWEFAQARALGAPPPLDLLVARPAVALAVAASCWFALDIWRQARKVLGRQLGRADGAAL